MRSELTKKMCNAYIAWQILIKYELVLWVNQCKPFPFCFRNYFAFYSLFKIIMLLWVVFTLLLSQSCFFFSFAVCFFFKRNEWRCPYKIDSICSQRSAKRTKECLYINYYVSKTILSWVNTEQLKVVKRKMCTHYGERPTRNRRVEEKTGSREFSHC